MTPPRDDRGMPVDGIIPAFRIEWPVECLVWVIGQSYPGFQLVVIDDGSMMPLSDCAALAAIFHDAPVRLMR